MQIPDTLAECDGTGNPINVLEPYLEVKVRPVRQVLVSEEVQSEDPNEVGEPNIYLGTKAGRSVVLKFADFDAFAEWVEARKGLKAKLEVHAEDEIYVPEDNPDDDELAARAAAAEEGES